MYKVGDLRIKHYGTEVVDSNNNIVTKVWVGFKNYCPDEVSPREKESGWSSDDPYYGHVESIYDLECAKAVAEKLNEMLKENNIE